MKTKTIPLILILFLAGACRADDEARFKALSMLESGDCDSCVGASGEVSRYQILPSVWKQYTKLPLSAAENVFTAENVARAIMQDRMDKFCKTTTLYCYTTNGSNWHFANEEKFKMISGMTAMKLQARGDGVDDEGFYLLWHRPARLNHPKPVELDRAQRFANLCAKYDNDK